MTNNKIWLITGASSGFGLELAKIAASKGDRVIAASRNPQKVDDLKLHENIKSARLDPNASLDEIKSSIAAILAIFGTVDIVVNNAGYVHSGILEEITPEETLQQFQANVFGPLNIYRAILPHLRQKKSGTLVSIGSMVAWFPAPACNLYNGSKAALRSLTTGLAGEVSGFGIRHLLVEPGAFRTELLKPNANFSVTDSSRRISDYAEVNANGDSTFSGLHNSQPGDVQKGCQVLYDVITSTGVAKGRELPEFLLLGSDACTMVENSAKAALKTIDSWREISTSTDYETEK